MATYTPARLGTGPTQLTTSYTTPYTVPAATTAVVKEIIVANPTTSAATVTVSVVPSGNSASAANNIIGGVSVAANSTLVFDVSQVLATGDAISALASAASTLNFLISGVTIQ